MKDTLQGLGLAFDDEVYEKLQRYMQLLIEWNKVMDLTNVPPEEMPLRHFADSLLPLRYGLIPEKGAFADVGTGAGFPGMPIAIAMKNLNVTLIDAQQKRCSFLQAVKEELSLDNVRVLHLRAEDAGRDPKLRERFDIAAARAVAPLNVLAEYLVPLVRCGGSALCWKGPGIRDEIESGRKAAQILGVKEVSVVDIPLQDTAHCIAVLRKTLNTPARYPRKSGMPSKAPLGAG